MWPEGTKKFSKRPVDEKICTQIIIVDGEISHTNLHAHILFGLVRSNCLKTCFARQTTNKSNLENCDTLAEINCLT